MRRVDGRVVLGFHRTRPDRGLLEAAHAAGVELLDTAINYQGFEAHRTLAQEAGELLQEFEITTKVGFFPPDGGARHSLEPNRLRHALWRSVEELGRPPTTVLLHNPEASLNGLNPRHAYDTFATACGVLADARTAGLCDAWGISSWNPLPLLSATREGADGPMPQVLMVRAGLTLDGVQLNAADELAAAFAVGGARLWGMSPFGGSTSDPVWATIDLSAFLEPGQVFTPLQAAYRLAFELPTVQRVAVGTRQAQHLRDLVDAVKLQVADERIKHYRQLIADSGLAETIRE